MRNLPVTAKISKEGHLEVGGIDCLGLVKEFGTPLYVLDEQTLRQRCREYKTSFRTRHNDTDIVYAAKALCTSPSACPARTPIQVMSA